MPRLSWAINPAGVVPLKDDCATTFPAREALATCAFAVTSSDGAVTDAFQYVYAADSDKPMQSCLARGGTYTELSGAP